MATTKKDAWKPWHGFAIEIGPDTDLQGDGLLVYEYASGGYAPVAAVSTPNEAQEIAASYEPEAAGAARSSTPAARRSLGGFSYAGVPPEFRCLAGLDGVWFYNGLVKKRSCIFVVHSSNVYAAAGAMGIAMARNESSGNFDPTSGSIAGGRPDPLARSQTSAPCATDPMIKVDFRTDWADFLQKDMTASGLAFHQSRTLEENTDRYLNAKRRIPRQAARRIHESKELRIPPQYANDYSALTGLIHEGGDLKPYLSRDIGKKRSPDKNDPLLNRWGIQHLHFRRRGPGDVLFVKITDTDVFVIQTFPHDDPQVWVNTSLLQIMHDNWPEMAEGRVVGIPGESLLSSERLALQYRDRNFATTMSDGMVYLSPGGGVLESGQCFDDRLASDRIVGHLAYWQKVVENNGVNFRTTLNVPSPEELPIKLTFENEDWWRAPILYAPIKQARLSLTFRR